MKRLVIPEFPEVPEYLTDAELESMILELEQKDMVPTPPDLQEQILEVLENQNRQERIRTFHKFRFQVLTTVAAAVLVVLLLPRFEELKQEKIDFHTPPQKYETKEEALNDSGMLETLLGGVNIFADNNRFNLFRK